MLWDIDHTLIETRGVGSQLYRAAFEEVTDQPMTKQADVTGKTEVAILAETLRLHGLEPSAEYQQRYAEALARQYAEHADLLRRQGRALPGAPEALDVLASQPGILQTVLTGNLRSVAIIKLETFGLVQHIDFDIGAYGDDHEERAELVGQAQRRASAKYRQPFTAKNTIIIGDSTHDVRAGLRGGAQVIGIPSGGDTADQLRDAGATTVLPDLIATDRLIASITDADPIA